MKPEKVVLKNYSSLLKEVKKHVAQTQASIERVVVRQKVEMAWSIGKSISEHLKKNSESENGGYGKHLFLNLQNDTGIDQSTLYRMYSFHETYLVLPKDDDKINWSHYQLLSGIEEKQERKYLEDLVRENDLSVVDLRKKIQKLKKQKIADKKTKQREPVTNNQKLSVRRGQPFCYQLVKPLGADKTYIDCGFKVYREVMEKLPSGAEVVESVKTDSGYQLKKSALTKKQIFTYKAYLKRVVDGDTIHAVLDLGFGLLHEETLRLTGINAAESETESGAIATQEIKKILADYDHFVVRTSSTDTYNRYLADIFLPVSAKDDLQKTADEGIYLSQLLLDRGVAEVF